MILATGLSYSYIQYSRFILSRTLGISTEKQITIGFERAENITYDMLILGSSLLYRGINPDMFTYPTAYNFAHDNDSYNQFYYKFERIVSENDNVKYLLLGVDYFNFSRLTSTRNHIYKGILNPDYLKDYEEHAGLGRLFNEFLEVHFSNTFMHIFRRSKQYFRGDVKETRLLKENGQYVIPLQFARENQRMVQARSYAPLDIQVRYFVKIIEAAGEKNIPVFLVFPPVRDYILEYPDLRDRQILDSLWAQMALKPHVYLLDYSTDDRFELSDFHDYIHLNTLGADKFSEILGKDLYELCQIRY
ncbi:MAG: hypothetical protein ACK4VN_00055 [Bacteroidales bacterium]